MRPDLIAPEAIERAIALLVATVDDTTEDTENRLVAAELVLEIAGVLEGPRPPPPPQTTTGM